MVSIETPAGIVIENEPSKAVVVVVVVPAGTPHGFALAVCAAPQVVLLGTPPTVTVKPARGALLTSSTAVPVIVTDDGVMVGVVVGDVVGATVVGVGEEPPPPPPHATRMLVRDKAQIDCFIARSTFHRHLCVETIARR